MRLFGLCPAKDSLALAVCKECEKVIQISMLVAHYGNALTSYVYLFDTNFFLDKCSKKLQM